MKESEEGNSDYTAINKENNKLFFRDLMANHTIRYAKRMRLANGTNSHTHTNNIVAV